MSELAVPLRDRHAAELGEFFARLHQPAPIDAPPNPFRSVPLAERTSRVEQHLEMTALPGPDVERIWELWKRLVATPQSTHHPLWLHGDPHPGNVLIEQGRFSAVLAFGDMTLR